ncbi:hypothetical protein LTR85_007930 [Meristemomyces frigidus]|nr:hypothetical protein LTR85_007930 [Meristemomyces frigidus]
MPQDIPLTINADVDTKLGEQRMLYCLNAAATHAVYLHLPAEQCYIRRPVSDLLFGRWRPGALDAQSLCVHLARDEQCRVDEGELQKLRAGFEEAREVGELGRQHDSEADTATIRLRSEQEEPFVWNELVWREHAYTISLSDELYDVFRRHVLKWITSLHVADTALWARTGRDKQVLSIGSNLDWMEMRSGELKRPRARLSGLRHLVSDVVPATWPAEYLTIYATARIGLVDDEEADGDDEGSESAA